MMAETPPASPADPPDARAAEYVVGTLSAREREDFERELGRHPELVELVRFWEERLTPVADAVPPVEPPSSLWPRIADAVAPTSTPSRAMSDESGVVISLKLARLRRSRSLWRRATVAAASLAASLAIYVALERSSRPEPASDLVAVVNRSGDLPALIVRVDSRKGTVRIRSLAAEKPAGRSLELWSIVGGGAPRSLGILTASDDRRPAIAAADRGALPNATLAVTVEPEGGSPSGAPTGSVIYSGKLVPERE